MADPVFISLIGTECTGKTVLAQQLAEEWGGMVVPEALRHWCEAQGRTPLAQDQAALMQAQMHMENQALALMKQGRAAIIFCDTSPLLTAVYSQHYFADSSLLAAAQAHHRRYALTLWLQPDLPWVADGLQRDGLAAQAAVHHLLAQQLASHTAVARIAGHGLVRLQAARAAITQVVGQGPQALA
ncbi:ATP-binding protein [Rhodoferax sp. 4810]|nr:ATP-binding protein [Rhodoferax jenense]